jgi:hypothetical protein
VGSGHRTEKIASVIVSALTTGLSSATFAYDGPLRMTRATFY